MTTLLARIGREIAGLFVDDGAFALCILLVVWAGAVAAYFEAPSLYVGLLLVIGMSAVLCESVWRALRR
ncbi:MAG: hypothetical protein J0J01_13815 [Reyranella sp.]|uniref:hypothetical protein n=1 Tax=Reyranella sp. TaxID=1929291 RepID=UPI001AD0D642|nr:hypothetical protein [Reyranella sp.]MBN9087982.1 hypothetical protein [Reyranella sp.]